MECDTHNFYYALAGTLNVIDVCHCLLTITVPHNGAIDATIEVHNTITGYIVSH